MYTLAAKKELGELVHKNKEKCGKELGIEEDKGNCSNPKPPSPTTYLILPIFPISVY